MCCLFGLIDTTHQMPPHEKSRVISILARAGEARGTDATGFACNTAGKLLIEKRPIPANKMRFRIPKDAHIVMGHTRMTTQGNALRCFNNHPFPGKAGNLRFALAHNGVLTNDSLLQILHDLPRSKIETDSYVAVQLIEQRNSLDLNSIRFMAEEVKGTFTFTILDRNNRLYIVKGNNPLCMYHFQEEGLYLYASTQPILDEAIENMGFKDYQYSEMKISAGEILVIDSDGSVTRSHFTPPESKYHSMTYSFMEQEDDASNEYRNYMMDYAETLGISRRELEWLHIWGISDDELEECIFDAPYRDMCLMDTGYYEEMEAKEHAYEYFNCPTRMQTGIGDRSKHTNSDAGNRRRSH